MRKKLITLVIMLLAINMFLIIYVNSNNFEKEHLKEKKIISSQSIVNNCEYKNLQETVLCLKLSVDEIYNYNLSSVGEDLTFEELKNSGGSCVHYSLLYVNSARALGYAANTYIVDMGNKPYDHMMAIISDKTGYCLVDQIINPVCVTIK